MYVFAHNTTYSDIILYFSCYTCYNKYCNKYFINLKYIAYKQGYIIVVKVGLKIKSLWKKTNGRNTFRNQGHWKPEKLPLYYTKFKNCLEMSELYNI